MAVRPDARAASSDRSTTSARSTAPLVLARSSPRPRVVAWLARDGERRPPLPPPDRGRPPRDRRARSTTGGAAGGSTSSCRGCGSSTSPGPRGSPRTPTGGRSASWSGSSARTAPTRRTSTWSATSPNHRRSGLGRALYERFFEDAAGPRRPTGQRRHLAGQPRSRSGSTGRWASARRRGRDPEPVRDARPTPTTTPTATTGSCSAGRLLTAAGVSCSWSSRPNRPARSASGTASSQRRRSASPSA